VKKGKIEKIFWRVFWCVFSLELLYMGIFNLIDILKWRKEITAPCIYQGVNLVTVYEIILHTSVVCIVAGLAIIYKLIKKSICAKRQLESFKSKNRM